MNNRCSNCDHWHVHRLNPSFGNCEGLMAGNREGDNFWVETEDNAAVVRFQTNENFF